VGFKLWFVIVLCCQLNRQAPVLRATPGRPLLNIGHLRSIADLQPFFNTLCLQQSEKSVTGVSGKKSGATPASSAKSSKTLQPPAGSGMVKSISAPEKLESKQMAEMQVKSTRQYVEELLERDFLEHVS
jgi:hypothetical protein